MRTIPNKTVLTFPYTHSMVPPDPDKLCKAPPTSGPSPTSPRWIVCLGAWDRAEFLRRHLQPMKLESRDKGDRFAGACGMSVLPTRVPGHSRGTPCSGHRIVVTTRVSYIDFVSSKGKDIRVTCGKGAVISGATRPRVVLFEHRQGTSVFLHG